MAIQHRRGVYTDFDPSKMRPAEPAVVVSGDPNATNGKAAYIAFAAGDVKQLATMDELKGYDAIAEDAKDDAVQAKNDTLALLNQATAAKTAAEAAQTSAGTGMMFGHGGMTYFNPDQTKTVSGVTGRITIGTTTYQVRGGIIFPLSS